jgi:hypothetical protein
VAIQDASSSTPSVTLNPELMGLAVMQHFDHAAQLLHPLWQAFLQLLR